MKRIVNVILTLCIVVSMLAGVSLNAFADGSAEVIYDIEVSGIPEELTAGEDISEIEISVPEDANYRIEKEWSMIDVDTGAFLGMESNIVEDVGIYQLAIYYYPDGGYVFADMYDINFDLDNWDFDNWNFLADEGYMAFNFYVGFEKIDYIEIVSIEAPVPGEIPSLDAIVLPEDAPYYVDEDQSQWYLYEAENDEWFDIEGTFEAGQNYELDLYLVPKEGFMFVDESDVETDFPVPDNYEDVESFDANYEFEFTTKEEITEIDISNLPVFEIGKEVSFDGLTLSENVVLSDESRINVDGVVTVGEYLVDIYLDPAEGYAFSYDVEITVNGEPVPSDLLLSIYPTSVNVWYYEEVKYPEIDKIEMSNVPTAVVGENAIIGGVVIPEDAKYAIEYIQWCDKTSESCDITTFEQGHKYTYNIRFIPLPGNQFAENVTLYIDGEYVDVDVTDVDYYDYIVEYSFLDQIDKVEVEVPEVVIGDIPRYNVEIPEDANYTVDGVDWYCVTDEIYNFDGVFEDGKKYELYVTLVPNEGYEFDEVLEVLVNGEEAEDYYYESDYADIWYTTSFLDVVESIEIDGVPEGEIGEAMGIDYISIPEDVPYFVDYIDFYDISDNEDIYDGVFEDGKKYVLSVGIEVADGYEFSDDLVVIVNGEECEITWYDYEYARYEVTYSFYEKLDEVNFPAFPEIEVGDEIVPVMPDLSQAIDGKYVIGGQWIDLDLDEYVRDGVFEEGKLYSFIYIAVALNGYEFAEDAVIKVNGEESAALFKMAYNQMAMVTKTYAFGVEAIDKIEITIPEPAEGEEPADIDDVIVPEDAKYTVTKIIWGEGPDEDFDNSNAMSGVFELGNHHFLSIVIETGDGYYISSEAEIYVNGKKVEFDSFYTEYEGTSLETILSLGELLGEQDEPAETPTETPSETPDSGDVVPNPGTSDSNIFVVLAVILALVAAAGMIFLRHKEER